MTELYDVHTHVGADQAFYLRGWWPYAATAAELLDHMDACGIDRAVCFPFTMPGAFDPCAFADRHEVQLRPGRFPFDRENRLLIQELDRIDAERRLLPLAMFDPAREVAAQLAGLQAVADRIAGLKTQTTILESPVRALLDEGRGFVEFARERDLPVLLHATVEPRAVWAQVKDCLDVAEAHGDVRFSLAHGLGFDREHLRRAAGLANVWVDCAALLAHCLLAREDSPIIAPRARRLDADYSRAGQVLLAMHDVLGPSFMWGTDNPYMSWCDDTLRIRYTYSQEAAVLYALPEVVRVSMAGDAPRAWLYGASRSQA